jgi:hypothetical protein
MLMNILLGIGAVEFRLAEYGMVGHRADVPGNRSPLAAVNENSDS